VNLRDMVRLEGLGKLKKFMTSELEPVTFHLVAKHLNHLCYHINRNEIGNNAVSLVPPDMVRAEISGLCPDCF
jgi:hypothetical protein